VLFALCKSAPLLESEETASKLLEQISPYLLEAYAQLFAPSPYLRAIEPSPWEALTYQLTYAVLAIGIKHPVLHGAVVQCTSQYLQNCLRTINAAARPGPTESASESDAKENLETATVSISLLGFLEVVSEYANFFTVPERLDLVRQVREIFDENLLVSVEGVFSSIRTSIPSSRDGAEWKLYTKRYATSGRPLGAMLLQRGFMKVVVSCSSLQICTAEQLQKSDVFDVLTSEEDSTLQEPDETDTALLELETDICVESMRLLEDGSDYLQLGSAWQQRLAFAVKALTFHSFLNCMVVDEEIADVDILMSWLEDAMADPIQMADDTLASVVLKSMAVVAKYSPAIASTLSRSLPSFIVQGGIKGETVIVAARSLTYILRTLSQDAVITGLYSLGNVLSSSSSNDRASGILDVKIGTAKSMKAAGPFSQNASREATGSTISLDLSGEEETSAAYGNIVRAIVGIANSCQEDKITALAQSMLLQKLGKVSLAVDIPIIRETAMLATAGAGVEFKALLKLYARLGHEGVVRNDSILLAAVRQHTFARMT